MREETTSNACGHALVHESSGALTKLAPGQDLLPGALLVQLFRGLDGLESPAEGLGREPCRLGAVEEDDGRVIDLKENDDHGAGGAIDRLDEALPQIHADQLLARREEQSRHGAAKPDDTPSDMYVGKDLEGGAEEEGQHRERDDAVDDLREQFAPRNELIVAVIFGVVNASSARF
jgi:hypothetical protein